MIEQATQTVQKTSKALQPAFHKTKDSSNAHEKIERRRKSKKQDDETELQSHFKIEKSFTPSSTALARTLGNFQKVLDFLETDPNDVAQENTKTISNEKSAQNAVPLLPQNQESQNSLEKTSTSTDIHLDDNPTDFKLHNIITDEIIKAISNSNRKIDIKAINAPVANSLAKHVRKLLAKQPHAIASDEKSAPVKAFEQTI